jgi:sugar lactone lactonase YvrE
MTMRRLFAALGLAMAAALGAAGPAGAFINVVTLAGQSAGDFQDGYGTAAKFNNPAGIGMQGSNILVADEFNHRIRTVTAGGQVTTLAGNSQAAWADGLGTQAKFNSPTGVKAGADGNVYVADYLNGLVRRISPGGYVATVLGGFYNQPRDVAVARDGTLYVAEGGSGWVERINQTTGQRVQVARGIQEPQGIAIDARGYLYVSDFGGQRVLKISPSTGRQYVLAGQGSYGVRDGGPGYALFGRPAGVALDPAGCVYVADVGTRRIRRITPYGFVSTLAGTYEGFQDGAGTNAKFDGPVGIATAPGGIAYVAEAFNHRIRKLSGIPPCPRLVPTRRYRLSRASASHSGLPITCATNQRATCTLRVFLRGRSAGFYRTYVGYSGLKFLRAPLSSFGRSLLSGSSTAIVNVYLSDTWGTRLASRAVVTLT